MRGVVITRGVVIMRRIDSKMNANHYPISWKEKEKKLLMMTL